eukprot:scaffold7375_cov268-Pinguiococcus_pyrenoidosus.AAC.15
MSPETSVQDSRLFGHSWVAAAVQIRSASLSGCLQRLKPLVSCSPLPSLSSSVWTSHRLLWAQRLGICASRERLVPLRRSEEPAQAQEVSGRDGERLVQPAGEWTHQRGAGRDRLQPLPAGLQRYENEANGMSNLEATRWKRAGDREREKAIDVERVKETKGHRDRGMSR